MTTETNVTPAMDIAEVGKVIAEALRSYLGDPNKGLGFSDLNSAPESTFMIDLMGEIHCRLQDALPSDKFDRAQALMLHEALNQVSVAVYNEYIPANIRYNLAVSWRNA